MDEHFLNSAFEKIQKIQSELEQKDIKSKINFSIQIEKPYKKYKNRKQSHNIICMCKNCNKAAINSHTISENACLRNIAIDGHVIQFRTKNQGIKRELILDKISVDDATTFKGYCSNHDSLLFKSIDSGELKTLNDLFLQCQRTISYSLYNEKFTSELISDVQKQVRDQVGKKVYDLCYNGQFDCLEPIININNIIDSLVGEQNTSKLTNNTHYYTKAGYEIHFCRINFVIPVAMYNYLKLTSGNMLYFITLPYIDTTEIIFICNKDLEFGLQWQNISRDELAILNFVERFMVLGENWVVNPSIVDKLGFERQQILTQDLNYIDSKYLFQDYDMSIFDEIRIKLVESLPSGDKQIIAENAKINNIPFRDSNRMEKKYYSKLNEMMQTTNWDI